MTIAACYVSSEGIVLGADSTATFSGASHSGGGTFFNHTQKLFEIGENSSHGIVTWGLGGLPTASYRTLIAQLADEFVKSPPSSSSDAATRWSDLIWREYTGNFVSERNLAQQLHKKGNGRTKDESDEFLRLITSLTVGFCLGSCCAARRVPEAHEIWVYPFLEDAPKPVPLSPGLPKFWGWSNLIERLTVGMDENLFQDILSSGKWTGTSDELVKLVTKNMLNPPGILPIREAIDWVYSSIYATIKALKFSRLEPVCGGPIEVAVISSDRKFRWVKHKPLDSAIT